MGIQYTIVDAFTSKHYTGNPACVILLSSDTELSDAQRQLIAREFNLPETAYLVPRGRTPSDSADVRRYGLRWFTPEMEFPICGHATLASAHVLFTVTAGGTRTLKFDTLSGELSATSFAPTGAAADGREIEITLPAGRLYPVSVSVVDRAKDAMYAALGMDIEFRYFGAGEGVSYGAYLVVEVGGVMLEGLKINPGPLMAFADLYTTVILTSPSLDPTYAFVSRVFAPAEGIPEDPVTGSAHCLLAPYWSEKLGIPPGQELRARQASDSAEGGDPSESLRAPLGAFLDDLLFDADSLWNSVMTNVVAYEGCATMPRKCRINRGP
ncbi:Diaminopimelate epimerase-like protein [Calocera cornea HHB12733]|uniref:Diaminopimelate epimerase-like protein n=1 Tax=Calocera cornea HHB12733 TaxID=1353952 RepID=A0A165CY84_9BASI|nr:Diaminopimelate epimerase-like protein [Calocera cornea HHB12733]